MKQKGLEVDAKFYMEHQLMNPISQLFALVVEQLPGCKAPGKKSWSVADDADREYAASEYLFRDALNICDKLAEQRFAKAMFGTAVQVSGNASKKPRGVHTAQATAAKPPVQPPSKYVQSKLNSMFARQMIMTELEKTVTPRRSARLSTAVKEATIE